MNKEKIEEILKSLGTEKIPEDIQILAKETSDKFSKELAQEKHPKQNIMTFIFENRISKLAAAAAIIIVVLFGLNKFGNSSIAWADVVEKFQSVEFFSAVFYEKDDALDEPEQIELWMGQGGNVRMRMGSQVIFGQGGKITKAFDMSNRSQVEPDSRGERMLEMLSSSKGQFSLGTILNIAAKGGLTDVTPLVNSDAKISEDLVVFDSQLYETQWMRIWALRESKLPVHIRIWDSRDGYCLDAFLTYSNKQPDEFFDPNAFDKVFRQQQENNTNIVYAFLTDPGGRDITPKDIFKKDGGYHMPVIKRAGISKGGAFWIVADKSRNMMPDGFEINCLSSIEDDLGRTYINYGRGFSFGGEKSLNIFLPLDFPFDERRPTRVTLTCDTREYHFNNPELIGTVDLTEWEPNTPCPQLSQPGITSDSDLKIGLAWNLTDPKYIDKLKRIIESIPGEPENNSDAFNRERLRLEMLVNNKQFEEAADLGEHLMPLLDKEYRSEGQRMSPYIFDDYIIALACSGKLDEAEKTWKYIISIEPELSNLTKESQKFYKDNLHRQLENCLRIMVPNLSSKGHLTIDQINKIFDIEIKNNELFQHYTFWDWNPEFEKPKYKNWERHLTGLAEYYQSHSLPETMEIVERDAKEEYGAHKREMPGITTHYVENIQKTLPRWATSYQSTDLAGRVRIDGDVPDIELNHDLVYQKDTQSSEIIPFVLRHFGLEIVEVNEPRTVWIANYDGRKLKDFHEVVAPVPYTGGERKVGMMGSSNSDGWGLDYLFAAFMIKQNKDYKAHGIVIIDHTGIKEKVSYEGPIWEGPEALDIARKWFHDEFGITFTEETRPMKTYVIKKRTE